MSIEDSAGNRAKERTPLLQSNEVPQALLAWRGEMKPGPECECLQKMLHATVISCCQKLRGLDEGKELSASDLAHDFLLSVLSDGVALGIETVSGLRTAIRRYLNKRRDPASAEAWSTLSDALRELAKDGRLKRLDAPIDQNNHNGAQWILVANAGGEGRADYRAFEKRSEGVRRPSPKNTRAEKSEHRKIISPSDAKTLALDLLANAEGWICMSELFGVFAGKVHVLGFDPLAEKDHEDHPARYAPESVATLFQVAKSLAEGIWPKLAQNGLTEIFCGYFLPKELHEAKVTMESFGKSSTVLDKSKKIKSLLVDLLKADQLEEMDRSPFHGMLVRETLEILDQFCACRPGNTEEPPLLTE